MNIALIVAGGSGLRMQRQTRKQYLHLAEKPVIAHTLLVFDNCPQIDRLILVLPRADLAMVSQKILPSVSLHTPILLVAGGDQRQDSVYNGLQHLDPNCQIVIIHDGVRPFVSVEQIDACITAAHRHGASILGIPAFDTLKKVSANGTIEATLDRQQIWLAQTPQAFNASLIKRAHQMARQANVMETDDAALVERLGHRVTIIRGSRKNIKITTPEDLDLCQAMLGQD